MKKENDEFFDAKVQKVLKKLISEETIAHDFYVGCIAATCTCQSQHFAKVFCETAKDELDDHCKKLVEWAIMNDYDVPFKYKDYEKFADEKVVKQFNSLKQGQDAFYYIQEALKSEQFAIESYEEALKIEMPYELHAIILQNYYEEFEHLQTLQTMVFAFENNAVLANY